MTLANCRTCGAQIIWATTEAGRAMPLNAVPSRTGSILLLRGSLCRVLPSIEAESTKGAEGVLYVSHFATCPNAASHRKKGKQ